MLPRSRGVPLENPPQTDPRVVFWRDCITASLYAKLYTSLPRQGHFTRRHCRRLHIFTDKRKFGNFTPAAPLPPAVGGISQRHSTLAPFHCKSPKTLGVSHRRKPPIILTVPIIPIIPIMRPPAQPCIPPLHKKKPVRLRRTGSFDNPKVLHQTDCATMASATRLKPAILAPVT